MGKLAALEDNHAAWAGDAALMWVTRLVLTDLYPDLPIKYLHMRQDHVVRNKTLTNYCEKNGLGFGCNLFELRFKDLALSNLGRAKKIILEIIKDNKNIAQLDKEQLIEGHLKLLRPEFVQKESERQDRKRLWELIQKREQEKLQIYS